MTTTKLYSLAALMLLGLFTNSASAGGSRDFAPVGADPIRCGTHRLLYGINFQRQPNQLHYAVTFTASGGGHVWFQAVPADGSATIPADDIEREYRIDVSTHPDGPYDLPLRVFGVADAYPCSAPSTDLNVRNIEIWVRMPLGGGKGEIDKPISR